MLQARKFCLHTRQLLVDLGGIHGGGGGDGRVDDSSRLALVVLCSPVLAPPVHRLDARSGMFSLVRHHEFPELQLPVVASVQRRK